ncbi:unnamed protein product [Pleuronectes platessa]|uniref:Uncharacterized protein n=1 Tax=Pleuronectes platessa TaxID=8262 RepID=A0A9N7W3Q6_PLEPL|nr:unnamed protein product [Pleuronectes platessa]
MKPEEDEGPVRDEGAELCRVNAHEGSTATTTEYLEHSESTSVIDSPGELQPQPTAAGLDLKTVTSVLTWMKCAQENSSHSAQSSLWSPPLSRRLLTEVETGKHVFPSKIQEGRAVLFSKRPLSPQCIAPTPSALFEEGTSPELRLVPAETIKSALDVFDHGLKRCHRFKGGSTCCGAVTTQEIHATRGATW